MRFRLTCLAPVAILLPFGSAEAASMVCAEGASGASAVVLGRDLAQIEQNYRVMSGGRPCRAIVTCAGGGWMAQVFDRRGNMGYSCGFPTKQQAIDGAVRMCLQRGGDADCGRYGEGGYDDGSSRSADRNTASMFPRQRFAIGQ
jgi:hypothetical protein